MADDGIGDLQRVASDLADAGRDMTRDVDRVLDAAGAGMVQDARQRAPRRQLPHYAKTITHETKPTAGGVLLEFGPKLGGQGSLGHILEFGSSRSGPKPHLTPAFDAGVRGLVDKLAAKVEPW